MEDIKAITNNIKVSNSIQDSKMTSTTKAITNSHRIMVTRANINNKITVNNRTQVLKNGAMRTTLREEKRLNNKQDQHNNNKTILVLMIFTTLRKRKHQLYQILYNKMMDGLTRIM